MKLSIAFGARGLSASRYAQIVVAMAPASSGDYAAASLPPYLWVAVIA